MTLNRHKDGLIMSKAASVRVILSARAAWVVANDADVAENV